MKKLIAILLGALLLVSTAACVKVTSNTQEPGEPEEVGDLGELGEALEGLLGEVSAQVAGGWTPAEDFTLTEDQKAIFDKAMSELVGVNYVPIACLGTQVVAGTNYCFLAQGTVVYPDATPKYMLVYVYADLTGGANVMNIADLPIIPNEDGTLSVPEEQLMGGWSYAEAYEITDELSALLNTAAAGLTGADWIPVAQVGTQVVAGTNHCVLCQIVPVVPNPEPHYSLVYIYEDLSGGAELLQTIDFDIGSLCTYGA